MADTLLEALASVKRRVQMLLGLQVVTLVFTLIICVWVWCCR